MFCAEADDTGELDHVISAAVGQTVVGIQFRSRKCCTDAVRFVETEEIDFLPQEVNSNDIFHKNILSRILPADFGMFTSAQSSKRTSI
jgi:hypothetical protein